jgi:ABC-type Zn uptake system ZnuABC Zn-binding protein ZnuA
MKLFILVFPWRRKKLVARWRIVLLILLVLTSAALPDVVVASLHMATTVASLTDLVQQVGGKLLHVPGLVPAGVNSRTFQPVPGNILYLIQVDLVILNGLMYRNLKAAVLTKQSMV